MPELPEVETVRRALALNIPDRRVVAVRGRSISMRRPLEVETLGEILQGRRFLVPRRRGKYLLLDTDPPGSLLVHLGMSGRLMLADADVAHLPHTHITLRLDDGRELRFVDPRRFGLMSWLEPNDEDTDSSLATLGREPLDEAIDQWLPPMLKQRRAPLKTLLLDQRVVAGVGNIYAAEALWRVGIRPTRLGRHTSMKRLARLAQEIRKVLEEAIEQGGTTIRDFATPDGDSGYFAIKLQVYGRQGQPCTRCGTLLRAEVIGGRTTAFCIRCQR